MTPTARPPAPAPARDLTDAEFAELDDLLAETPAPLEPLDAVMLDGFLCGVIVQPVLLAAETWLPHVFDLEGTPLPEEVDPAWRDRVRTLTLRRHAALTRAIAEDGWFDPLVLEVDDDAPQDDAAGEAPEEDGVDPISRALLPWVAGFQHATIVFPDLAELPDDAVMAALARLYRHLPAETDEEREVVETLAREQPLATLDDGVEDLVLAVADLEDLTRDLRFHVETVRRDAPKVGRNDPCPCGSGKKFKQCHGAG